MFGFNKAKTSAADETNVTRTETKSALEVSKEFGFTDKDDDTFVVNTMTNTEPVVSEVVKEQANVATSDNTPVMFEEIHEVVIATEGTENNVSCETVTEKSEVLGEMTAKCDNCSESKDEVNTVVQDESPVEDAGTTVETSSGETINTDSQDIGDDCEPETEVEEHNEGKEKIIVSNEEVLEAIAEIKSLFLTKIEKDTAKNQMYNNMKDELDAYKSGIDAKIFKNIIKDLLIYVSDMHRMVRNYKNQIRNNNEVKSEDVIDVLDAFESDMIDLLEEYSVVKYEHEEKVFEPRKQRALKIIKTSDESLDKQIAERLVPGFMMDDRILEKERVNVYRYEALKEEPNDN